MSSGQVPRTVNKPCWLWLLSVLVTSASSAPAPSGARLKSSRVKKMATEPSALAASLSGDGAHTQWTGGPMQAEPEKRPVRDQKKGPFAWQSVRQQSAIAPIEHERLLIHSVSDNTALCSYLPAVSEFGAWAEAHQPHLVTWGDLGLAITVYLTASCYVRDRHPLHGSLVLNGLAYTRSPSQDSLSQDSCQGLGCSGTHLFIGSG